MNSLIFYTEASEFEVLRSRYFKKYGFICNHVPELIALKNGLKIATQITIVNANDFPLAYYQTKTVSKRFGFYFYHYLSPTNKKNKIVISSKKLEDPRINFLRDKNKKLLSIPVCCFDKFNNLRLNDSNLWFKNYFLSDKQKISIPFLLNPFTTWSPFHLFKHRPCLPNCNETLVYAKKIIGCIKKENRVLYEDILKILKSPILFFDKYAIGFEGKIINNKLIYKNLFFLRLPSLPKQDKIILDLKNGDEIILNKNELLILKNKKIISTNRCSPKNQFKLISFS